MHDRPDKRPGQWKEKPNQAENVMFAAPETVNGTLAQGLERYLDLSAGFARAVFMHFVITQVQPFDDGNGRLARLFLSVELVSVEESKIVIPNVKRDDYINGLRPSMSRRGKCWDNAVAESFFAVVTAISATLAPRRSNKPQNAAERCPSDQGNSTP